ncbi:MAG TPA: type II secretion system protein N [Burkholderiaceae bacterium]|nr:type II secretion system protein N [Burkholderiaceae bacterium]
MIARRAVTLALFVALCALVAYWAMVLSAPRPVIAPAPPPAPTTPTFDSALHARLFGGANAGTQTSNIRVVGVIAPEGGRTVGVALLAVDNKPVKPYAAGQPISPGVTLSSVQSDRVIIDQGGANIELRVPPTQAGVSTSNNGGAPAGGAAAVGTSRVLQGGALPGQADSRVMPEPQFEPPPQPNERPERPNVQPDARPPTPNPRQLNAS